MPLAAPLQRLIGHPFVRDRYVARVGSVVDRYLKMQAIRSAPARGQRVELLYMHPSAWAELERLDDERIAERLEGARAEVRNLRAAAPVPAPSDRPERATVLAIADLQWLMRELRALARRSRRFGPERGIASYLEQSRTDPIEGVDLDLVHSLRELPRARRLGAVREIVTIRHGATELTAYLSPKPPAKLDRVEVGKFDELREGRAKRLKIDDNKTIAVFKHEGCIHALDDTCPHRGGPLGKGEIMDGRVFCPLHGWAFELETGRMRGNDNVSVRTFETTVDDDGTIWVDPD